MNITQLLAGWWLEPSEKYEFVSWDDDIPNMLGKIIHSCSKPPTRLGICLQEMIFHVFKIQQTVDISGEDDKPRSCAPRSPPWPMPRLPDLDLTMGNGLCSGNHMEIMVS
jgi:hypothetical protein